ncbi:MAG: WecB/TagA/CpsF family glycosyltransferase [Phycisphaerales bacterium]|nr:MAG: WecB/TagA/CpsF family glycosyltransferase [Phycisphaerales bacterium]
MISSRSIPTADASALGTQRIDLLDVPFDVVTFENTLDLLIGLARGDRPAYAVTANVDHVVRFHRCPEVRYLYREADLVVADGMPLIWASRLLGTPLPERVAGSDLFPALCARAAEFGLSVFLLGGAPGTAQRAAEILQARHPRLRVAGTYCPDYGFEKDSVQASRVVAAVRAVQPDILFVGLGSPKQEKWIAANRTTCGAKLNIGVGISFSFVCGDVRRAPRWMRRIGLEWAHRLFQEPRRLWKRYLLEDPALLALVLRRLLSRRGRAWTGPEAHGSSPTTHAQRVTHR